MAQGIGAGLQQLAFAGASEIVPKKNRGMVVGALSFAALPGSAFGSVIGMSNLIDLGNCSTDRSDEQRLHLLLIFRGDGLSTWESYPMASLCS